jgi:lactate permease
LISGGFIALPLLAWYGRSQKNQTTLGSAVTPASDPVKLAAPTYTRASTIRAYIPLLLAISYAIVTRIPAVAALLGHAEFQVSAWGFSPVKLNLLTTPAVPLLVAIASCYLVKLRRASFIQDFTRGTAHGASSLSTLLFGSATVYLMVSTGQIVFLGQTLAQGGKTIYELLDAVLIFLGGMTFGQGAPAIFLFSRMQMASAVKLGLPLALLVGLVNLVAMGPTNAVKPALIRFAASLVKIKGRDRDIFLIGLNWGIVQIIITTLTFMILLRFWK